jgi:hypothetical protein
MAMWDGLRDYQLFALLFVMMPETGRFSGAFCDGSGVAFAGIASQLGF